MLRKGLTCCQKRMQEITICVINVQIINDVKINYYCMKTKMMYNTSQIIISSHVSQSECCQTIIQIEIVARVVCLFSKAKRGGSYSYSYQSQRFLRRCKYNGQVPFIQILNFLHLMRLLLSKSRSIGPMFALGRLFDDCFSIIVLK